MPKRKSITTTEIRKLLKSKNLVIGTERTIKNLKLGKVEKVILSSNCPESVVNSINYYSDLSKAEIIKTEYPNDELAVLCKKPFHISVLSILKNAK